MTQDIEKAFFKAFELGGTANMCLKWIRHKYDLEFLPNGNNASIEDVEKMYDEMEQVSIDYTNRFDFKTIENGVDSPIIAEIENNLKECASEPEKSRYLFSLITPFGNWAMLLHPKAQKERYRAAIAECEQRLREWQNERQFIDDNTGKVVNPQEQIEACENAIQEYRERIQRLDDNSKRFKEIIYAATSGSTVEWCCFKWFTYALKYANRLDALLLTYGIDLIKLQKRCGVYLKDSRSITDVEYYIGSLELAEYYIDLLHTTDHNKRGDTLDRPEVSTLPDELATPEATTMFNELCKNKLAKKRAGCYSWCGTNTLFGYFVMCTSDKLGITHDNGRLPWRAYQRAFAMTDRQINTAKNALSKLNAGIANDPRGYDVIKRICKSL